MSGLALPITLGIVAFLAWITWTVISSLREERLRETIPEETRAREGILNGRWHMTWMVANLIMVTLDFVSRQATPLEPLKAVGRAVLLLFLAGYVIVAFRLARRHSAEPELSRYARQYGWATFAAGLGFATIFLCEAWLLP